MRSQRAEYTSFRRTAWVCLGIGVIVAAFAIPSLAASPTVDVETLTLAQAITLAREHAPKLQDGRAKVALAQLDVQATRWWQWLIPSVSAQPGYDFLAGQERAAVALSLDLSKFLGAGAREAEKARIHVTQAERALATAEAEVVAEVTKAYFAFAELRATVPVREAAVAQALKLQALQTIRFEHGSSDLAPLLEAQATLARARLELLRTQQAVRLAELELLRAIGLPLTP
jgi:outer membrane protein